MSLSNSLPHVVQGNSGHEESDGEVASVPFTGHEKEGEKRIRGSVFRLTSIDYTAAAYVCQFI